MAGDPLGVPVGGRHGVAHGLAQLGLFCLPALVLTVPINLLPYGLLLLLAPCWRRSCCGARGAWPASR